MRIVTDATVGRNEAIFLNVVVETQILRLDRLMSIINRLGSRVEVKVKVRRDEASRTGHVRITPARALSR